MQKLKTFFHSFINSCFNPSYYNKVIKTSFGFSWKYFLFLMFAITLVPTIQFGYDLNKLKVDEITSEILKLYPDELEIHVSSNGIEINQELPYKVKFPQDLQDEIDEVDSPIANILVFDSDENIQGVRDFHDSKSFVLITETTIYALKDLNSGETRVYPIEFSDETPDQTFTKNDLNKANQALLRIPFIKNKAYVPILTGAIFLLILIGYSLFKIVSITINSLFVLLIKTIFFPKKPIGYSKIFQMHLHAITPFIILEYFLGYIKTINYTFTTSFFVFLVWMTILLSKLEDPQKNKALKKVSHATKKTAPTKTTKVATKKK